MLGEPEQGNSQTDGGGDVEDPKPRKPGRPSKLAKPVVPSAPAMSTEQWMEAIRVMAEEMRKPTASQAKKDAEEEAKLKKAQHERVELAKAEEQRKAMNAIGCPHSTYNAATGVSKHLWRAQVMTPANHKPYFVPMCCGCLTQLKPIAATTEMLTQGVNLDMYPGLTKEALEKWAAGSPGS